MDPSSITNFNLFFITLFFNYYLIYQCTSVIFVFFVQKLELKIKCLLQLQVLMATASAGQREIRLDYSLLTDLTEGLSLIFPSRGNY